jgi:hypothetical protein
VSLTAPAPLDLPHGWPLAAWQSDPVRETRQLTHAVWPGHSVALCGLVTTVTGEEWPAVGEPWLLPRMRCSYCHHAVVRELG